MLAKTSHYIFILTILTVAAITAVAGAQTTQPARMFNSTLALDVYDEAEIDRDGFVKHKLLGKTPSDKPIAIPQGVKWSVSPNNTAIKDVGLRAIYKEIGDQDIPGLKLYNCENITDAGLANLKELTKVECLGFLKGSHSPHYDAEEQRRPTYQRMILSGEMKPGYACDNDAGIYFEDNEVKRVVHTREGARVYYVSIVGGRVVEEALDSELIT